MSRLGSRLRAKRCDAGLSRLAVARLTGLNPKTIYRIEAGERRTRARAIAIMATAISDDADRLTRELIAAAGPALAEESKYLDRVEGRRIRRVRRGELLEQRAVYAAERAELEAEWAARTERHLAFRANLRLFDIAFRALRRLGAL
jgi:transcriptional regulator with XRE-family HTH domain